MKALAAVFALLFTLISSLAVAQSTAAELELVKADPQDVPTIDASVNAYYDSLACIDGRWWIVTLPWSGQSADQPFPERYLSEKN